MNLNEKKKKKKNWSRTRTNYVEHQWGYEIPKQDDMWWGPHVIHWNYKTRYARWTTQSASREERRQADKWVPDRFPTQSSSVGSTSSVVPRIVPLLIIRGRPPIPPTLFPGI